jgi:ABC-2 type transport system permease protein
MSAVRLIVGREFTTRVRTRGFVFTTVLGVLGIVALNLAPSVIDRLDRPSQLHFLVVMEAGAATSGDLRAYEERLALEFRETMPDGGPRFRFEAVAGGPPEAERKVSAGEADGYVVLVGDGAGAGPVARVEVVTSDALGAADGSRLEQGFSSAATYVRMQERGIDPAEVQALFAPVPVQATVLGGGPVSERDRAESMTLTYALVFLQYITIAIYGTYVAMGVVEEKSSRVVEILVANVRATQLMMGKVLGLGSVALTQYGIWLVVGLGLLALRGTVLGADAGSLGLRFSDISPWLLVAFAGFFLLGFFEYAGLFAGGGATVSRTEDAQQVTGPLTMVLVAILFVAIYGLSNPDAPMTVIFALLPLSGPIVMFVRVALGNPAAWEVALSVVIGLATIAALLWGAARVYRAGILLYGRRMSLSAVARALR